MSSRRPDGTLRRSNRRSQCQPGIPSSKKVQGRRQRRMQTVGGFWAFKSLSLFRSSSISKLPSVRQDYRSHFQEIQRSIKLIRASGPSDDRQVLSKLKNIPRRPEDRLKKTLIFDLDETLVHCTAADEDAVHVCDNIYVQIRPFAQECLAQASQNFEVFVFTASLPAYADPVIDLLDPNGTAVQYRLYRNDCITHPQGLVKDLRILNRNLEDIIIVDNSVWSFASQIDNGVPILPWSGDPLDVELRGLLTYLKQVSTADDVRDVNRTAFKLHEL